MQLHLPRTCYRGPRLVYVAPPLRSGYRSAPGGSGEPPGADSNRSFAPLSIAIGRGGGRGLYRTNSGASTSVIVLSSLISTCSAGPAESLNGSPIAARAEDRKR